MTLRQRIRTGDLPAVHSGSRLIQVPVAALYQPHARAQREPVAMMQRPEAGETPRQWAVAHATVTLEALEEVSTVTDRVLYQDVIPYEMPSSLAALHGPTEGVVSLPLTVHWGPDATGDLSTSEGVEKVYENVIREGTSDLQEALLDSGLLHRVWPQLRLPKRCRDSWEARFPELAAA